MSSSNKLERKGFKVEQNIGGIEKYEGQTLKITDIGYKIDSKMGVFDFSGGQINFFLQFNAM